MLMDANGDRHLGIRKRTTGWSRNSLPFRNLSINKRDMSDFRNFRNYCTPRFFDWSTSYMSGAWRWIDRKIKSPTYNCAQRKYFRFAAAILETDCYRQGQFQTVGIHPGNTSEKWETVLKINFRFAAATNDCIWNRMQWPCTVGYIQKTRQKVSIVVLKWSEITLIICQVMFVKSFSTVCQRGKS